MASSVVFDHPELFQFVRPISLDSYHALCEIDSNLEKTELIQGVIIEKMTKSPEHNFFSNLLAEELHKIKPEGSILLIEKPISLLNSEPEPDIAIVSGSFYDFKFKNPETALLVVEIARSSISLDRVKKEIYASARIPEYWIVNLKNKEIEVYSEPREGKYEKSRVYSKESKINIFQSELDLKFFFD